MVWYMQGYLGIVLWVLLSVFGGVIGRGIRKEEGYVSLNKRGKGRERVTFGE